MSKKYQWQGEFVKVRHGSCAIKENTEKPLFWYNYECLNAINYDHKDESSYSEEATLHAIQVDYHGSIFTISNHFGIGYHKLINGGLPNFSHFSLPNETFHEQSEWNIRNFDLQGYEKHEAERRLWQKKNYPIEYQKMEDFKNSFIKFNPIKKTSE